MNELHELVEVPHVGVFVRGELDARGWSVTDLAEILGRPLQAVSEILNGRKEVTPETAVSLGDAFGTSPDLWLQLQAAHHLHQASRRKDSAVQRRARLRALMPLAEPRRRGWISDSPDLEQVEREVHDLLGVDGSGQAAAWLVAARRSNPSERVTPEQAAWLGYIRRVARDMQVAAYDQGQLARLAGRLPTATRSGPESLPQLPSMLAEVGVILVFAEGLRGGKLDGAVTILDDGRPVIGLTARRDRFDGLLYSLLHECAHLTLGHLDDHRATLIDDDLGGPTASSKEHDADRQALRWLFPGGLAEHPTSVAGIAAVAARHAVHPSVVLGQVQAHSNNWKLHATLIPKVKPVLAAKGLLQ